MTPKPASGYFRQFPDQGRRLAEMQVLFMIGNHPLMFSAYSLWRGIYGALISTGLIVLMSVLLIKATRLLSGDQEGVLIDP